MRLLAIGLGIGVIMFVLTAGHVVFLPLLLLPLGLFSLGHRRHERADPLDRRQNDGWGVMWMSSAASLHEWHLYTNDDETSEAA